MKHTLEGSKWFPYIAWGTVVIFALFTYNLLSGIKESILVLEAKTEENNEAISEYIAIKKEQHATSSLTRQAP